MLGAVGTAVRSVCWADPGWCVTARLSTAGSQFRVSFGELHFFRELQPTQRLTQDAVARVAPAFVVYPYGVKGLATIRPSTAALSFRGGFGSGTDPNPRVAIAPRTEPSETLRLSTQRWGIVVNRPGALWLIGRVGSKTQPGACEKVPYNPLGSGGGERSGREKWLAMARFVGWQARRLWMSAPRFFRSSQDWHQATQPDPNSGWSMKRCITSYTEEDAAMPERTISVGHAKTTVDR